MEAWRGQLRAWLVLGRVSNLPTVWTNVFAAWLLGGGGQAWSSSLGWILLGTSLLYIGGTTLNDFFDAAFDREYRRERPIPSGVLSRSAVGWMSLAYLGTGFLLATWAAGGSWGWGLGLVAAIVCYDYRHKDWVGAVFVMGACRWFLVLLAASCVQGEGQLAVWVHATGLFVYIVGLSLTARGESRETASRGGWEVLLGVPLLGALWVAWGAIDLAVGLALVLAAGAIVASLRRLRQREDGERIGKAVSLMLAGIALVDSVFLATVSPMLGLWGVLGFLGARVLQRSVPAT